MDPGLELRRPRGPGSNRRLIHHRFLSWMIIGPDLSLRSSALAAMRLMEGVRLGMRRGWEDPQSGS